MTTEVKIRPARRGDAADLAVLVDMASEGMASHMWREMGGEGESPTEIGRQRALREEGGFSYRNTWIADVAGETAGMLVGYVIPDDGGHRADVPPLVSGLVELEQQVVGFWYVNVLAVYSEFRRRGIGKILLELADRQGRESNAAGMAIIVASGNHPAHRLYRQCGYEFLARTKASSFPGSRSGDDWLLLTKPIA